MDIPYLQFDFFFFFGSPPYHLTHKKHYFILYPYVLQWMSGHTRKDMIRNGCIREKFSVVPIDERMSEYHLGWFGVVSCEEKTNRGLT